MKLITIRELLIFHRWGHERVLSSALPLSDTQLDQPFDMGLGALRATLNHLFSAERVWLDRWKKIDPPRFRTESAGIPVSQFQRELLDLADERDAFVNSLSDADLSRPQSIRNLKGELAEFRLGDMLLHVVNHAIHHRAQVVNMVKRVGGKPPTPGADYIFMRLEKAAEPAPPLDVDTIRAWLEHADWGREKVNGIAAGLSPEQLDRPFEMGLGSLRRTLIHIAEAESWWWENWHARCEAFPEWPATMPMDELQARCRALAQQRNRFVATLNDAELSRPIRVIPRPGRELAFPLGVSLLQICCHGTHHRAQALNMLRHSGTTPPPLDYIFMRREQAERK